MSLLATASPYNTREGGGGGGGGGDVPARRRKATLPSVSEKKKYMTQLIQKNEPDPSAGGGAFSFGSYNSGSELYPALETNDATQITNDAAQYSYTPPTPPPSTPPSASTSRRKRS